MSFALLAGVKDVELRASRWELLGEGEWVLINNGKKNDYFRNDVLKCEVKKLWPGVNEFEDKFKCHGVWGAVYLRKAIPIQQCNSRWKEFPKGIAENCKYAYKVDRVMMFEKPWAIRGQQGLTCAPHSICKGFAEVLGTESVFLASMFLHRKNKN
jgi:hypothetical protein